MKKGIALGLVGVGLLWAVLGWIKAHSFLDLFSVVFIAGSFLVLSWFTFVLLRGAPHN